METLSQAIVWNPWEASLSQAKVSRFEKLAVFQTTASHL
jgi:hypothetical protein